ncbi:TPA_asm: BapA prefix-like domain-containing protein [Salmonella enterica subsp. enterica serovar Typhimurium str. SL1344]|uniref:BapA prefix-like domain-containing protein n=2 Tax=Salmonella enterica I TaxID=59201 RepID=A0A719DAC6_SALTS|nr:BapA prefix-like domain-containing protein [Salmonella enterica subsp. enterica]HAD2682404.1 BapA prefix-like domain-containing protein [Salmonella enterica subsp. enterica]HAD2935786.1 BapA prefix-like domain-containing protein [Salmonella enterica subsp. enterica]HAD6812017.1 BapA prefix-like domain-containing protein [Salmonella enterica subsp. enterica serovar Typhimurium str. SL1344]HAD6873913.1 BapA prefix-like domain-containing protein [Salmonella enterica subsp. enterica serovar Typh
MRLLAVVSKLTGVSTTVESSAVTLNAPSIVKLSVAREEISQLTRINQDLVVTLHSGETITIKNFYVTNDLGASQLVLAENDGTLWWVENPQAGLHFEQIADINELLVTSGASHEAGGAVWPWVLAGAVAAGGIAAIASSGGGDSHHHSDGDNPPPDNTNPDGNPPDNSNPGGSTPNGNTPGSSNPVDTTPPLAPGELLISADGKTVSGQAEAGSTITIKDPSGNVVGEGKADSDGKFSIDLTAPQISGEQLTVTATDDAGNTGPSATIDAPNIPLPDTPAITAAIDDAAPLTSTLSNNQFTNDNTPTLEGTGSAGTVIHIYANGQEIGSTTVDTSGNWHFAITSALADGENHFTAIATNVKGESSESARFTLTIDTLIPDAPRVELIADNTGLLTGPLQNNDRTDEAKPLFSGQGEAGNTITIKEGSTVIGSATVDENGRWTFTPTTPLSDGEHTFTVEQSDKAGNTSRVTTTPTIIVDTTPPDAAIIDNVAKDGTTVSGTAEAGSTVSIYDPAGNYLGSTITGENNHFSITLNPAQTHGERLEARIQDAVGNIGPATEFTASDSQYPAQPTILTVTDDAGAVTGLLKNGDATDDNRPTLSGTAEPGSTISINDNGFPVATFPPIVADADGKWSFTPSLALADGDHVFTATATNDRGTSGQSVSFTIDIDTQPPVLEGLAVSDVGYRLTGTTEAGSTVVIKDSLGNTLGSGTAGDDGTFSIGISPAKINGETLSISVTDKAANSGPVETLNAPDKTAPAAPDGLTVATDGLSVSGQAEAGATVTIRDSSNTVLGSAVANGNGQFIVPLNTAQTNGQALIATATDSANNVSPPTTAQAPDITAPDKPIITQVLDDVESFTGPLVNGQTTNDNRPTLSGTAEAGARVEVFDNGVSLGLATLQPNGAWTFTPSQNLGEGAHRLTVIATDAKGNASQAASFDLVVDTQSPQQPVITFITDDAPGILGSVAHLGLTNDSTPTINGTGEPGSTVHLYQNGARIADIIVGNSGVWSYAYTTASPLADDTYTFTVTASDSNGNTTPFSTDFTITIDTQAPAAPGVIGVADGDGNTIDTNQITQESQPRLSGSGTAGDTIILYDNGNAIGQALVGTDGRWQFTPPAALGDGDHHLTARANDPAGNESPESISFTLRIDTQAPDAPQIVSAAITGGEGEVLLANGSITNQRMPTLSGTGEPGTIITLYNNGVELATVQVNPQGSWTYPLTRNLSEGLNILTATATDAAGNSSPTSGVFSVTLDTQPPAQPDAPLISDNVAPVIGNIGNNGATNDTTPTFSGTGEIGSTIILYNNGSEIGRTTVGDNGSWNFTPAALTPETYTITVTETDRAGNISPPSASVTFTLDTTAPANPVITFAEDNVGEVQDTIVSGATTDDNTPVIHGTGDIGSIITLYNGSSVLGVVTVDETGTWTLAVTSALPDGVYTLTAIAADAAGNSSGVSNSFTFTVDTVPLQPPVVNEILDDVAPVTGPLTDGAFTNDRTLTINGSGENGSTVTIYDNGVAIGTALVTDGVWTFNTPELSEASHALTFSATDDAGNTTAQTQPITITVDITAPPAPTIQTVDDDGTRVTGLADPYATVEIHHADGTLVGSAVANGTGEFVVTLSPAQTDGGTLTAIAIDRAGNNGPATNFPASDSGLPAVPAITAIEDDVGSVQGNIAAGGATDDTMPTLRGTTDIGSTVEVFIDGDSAGFATVDASGNWIFEIATPLSESTHYFTVQATNANGPGGLSAPVGITVDLSAPAQPVITSATDDVPGMTGTLDNGALTNDSRPTLNGTGEAGATIRILDNGVEIGSATVDQSGNWRFTPNAPLESNAHIFTAVATDPAGNSGQPSDGFTLNIDAQAPDVPVITSVIDDNNQPTVPVLPGQSTDDRQPILNGTGEPGATITIFDNGTPLGTAQVGENGSWTFPVPRNLSEGSHNLTVSATEPAGNTSAASEIRSFTIDTTAPAAPVIDTVYDGTGPITGNLSSGQITDEARPVISGTREANTTIRLYDNGTLLAEIPADNSSSWRYTPDASLATGNHVITVIAVDAAGNASPVSDSVNFVVDTTPPLTPVITSVSDDQAPGLGTIANGQNTNDPTPTFSGTAEAGATITLYENGTVIGTTTAQPDGAWSVSTSTLASGTHVITAVATDAAGNSSPNSTAFTLTVDTTAPQTPILTSVVDDVAGGVTGNLANGQITNDNRPTLNGTAEAGSVVSIYDGDTLLGVTSANASGAWSFTPTTGLNDGTRTLTVTATDPAGNVSPATSGFTIVVDTLAPTVPLITSIVDDVPNNTGAIGNGQSTNDTQPTLNGTAEANSAVSIFDNSALVATVNANASGNWSWTPTAALGQGSHAYSVSAADAAGNVSAASPSITIIVDTIAPGAPGNLVINATGNRVTGTAEAGSTVTITSDTGVVLGTATADGTGSFTATLTPAQTNGQPLLAFAQDKAGNTGIAAGFTAPDTRVPEAPIITNVVDDVGIYTGAIANGQVTNDAQPTLNGTAQAGATVSIYNNGALLGTTTANASGNWSFTPTGNLTEGSHAFTATATNANGTGSFSTAATVIVDTLAPGTPSGTLSADGGSLSGLAEANSTVTVTLTGGVTLTTTAGSNGAWSLTLPTKQIEGQLINVTATDAAGNASGTLGITAPVLPLAARDNITSLDLTSTAVTSTQSYSDYGLLLVGALGNVASVLGNDTAQVEFTIAEGGTGDVTIDAAATGIVLSLLSTQEIVVQRYDTSLGAWTTIVNTAVGDFANLLTLTGSGVTLNLSGLGEGQYRVLTYNTSLLATGSYTSLDVDVHQTSAGIISGPTISTGNVMADDTAPTGTTVTAITNANGVSTPVGAGGVDIQGQYGTLHINQDGSYTYTLAKPTAGYGHKESFTYTITQNGVGSSAAQLVINLGPAPVPGSVIATDNNASLVFDTHVSYVNNGPSTQSGVTVLSVGLGNVLNANLLDDMTNPIIFNVEEGATRTMTLQGTVGGVSLVSTFDLYVYRFNDAIQQYEQFRVEKGWINTLLLAGQSQPLTLTLPGGEYLFVLNTASGISVLTGYTLAISQDHTYAVDSITANTTGNVLTNDVVPTDALLTEVNGVAIAATGTTEVNGLYGSLIIDARGNYTYTLKNGVGADSIKTPDSFIYTVKAPNGDTDTASLNITPTARALDAINDVSDILSVATLQDTAAWLDSSVGSASWGLLGKSGSGSGTFDVATGTVLKGASLVFDVSTLITLGNLNISWAIQENGTVIRNGTVPVANITLGSATVTVNLSGLELDAGTYTLNFTGTNTLAGAATITPRVIGTTVDLDNFETSGTHTVLGNIFDGSDAAGAMDQLNTVNTRLSISGYNGSAATLDAAANTTSATIQGHYGTLQINLDGAYTYTLNNGVAMSSITSKEVFTYQLDDKMGHTDSATLTIDMAPQIVSTNQNDVLIGSAYGDTLIYHLLNGADATGGNGVDRWQNFSTAQGDKIDIHELLTGWDHQAATLGNFVQVHTSGANTVISVDRDGAGSAFKSTDLVTLENVQLTLNDLLQNNHLITGG